MFSIFILKIVIFINSASWRSKTEIKSRKLTLVRWIEKRPQTRKISEQSR